MIKRLDKRGQGFTTGQLLALILGAVAVVIVIIGFTQGWGFFTDLFGQGDVDITVISQKCETLASTQNSGYCTDRIEIKSNVYVNCEYAVTYLGANVPSKASAPECSDAEEAICNKLKLEEEDLNKVKVNNKLCNNYGVTFP